MQTRCFRLAIGIGLMALAPAPAFAESTFEKCFWKAAEVAAKPVGQVASEIRRVADPLAMEQRRIDFEEGAGGIGVMGSTGNPVGPVLLKDIGKAAKNAFGVQLESSNKDSRVALSYNRTSSVRDGGLRSFEFSVSAAENKGGDKEIVRLGDINSDVDATLAYTYFGPAWQLVADKDKPEAERNKDAAAAKLAGDILKACTGNADADLVCPAGTKVEQVKFRSDCVTEYLGHDAYLGFLGVLSDATPAMIFGVAGSAGRTTFKYMSPTTGAESKERQSPWSAEVYVGRIAASRDWLVRAGYKHAESYKAADSRNICFPLGGAGALECKTGAFAAPSEKTSEIVYLEYRRFIDTESSKGLQLRLSYDFEGEKTEFDAPIYLYSDKDKNLNGGIRVTWNDDDHDVVIGLFVGAAFDFGKMFGR